MRIVVQKYGGSSVADLDCLRGVAARIARTRAAGFAVAVVVSAMGNTTDELIALARQVSPRPDRRELDMLLSVGERVAMALLAMALRELGVPAVSLTGSQSGIITDEAHAQARVVEVRPARVRAALEAGDVVIVAGFQGVSRAREVTTLGRGGSDTTAVVLAAALGAEHCEINSDVDGVWSADPRVVPSAHKVDVLSLDEGLALARGGAKVLFEDAVRYARDRGIVLVASSTFGGGTGTRLVPGAVARDGAVAVTGDRQLVALRAPADAELPVGLKVRRMFGDRLIVDVRDAHGALAGLPPGVVVEGPVAAITAVGSGLGERRDVAIRAASVLHGAGAPGGTVVGAGDALWWEVPAGALEAGVRALHDALVGASP
jgi:aspartate kinase